MKQLQYFKRPLVSWNTNEFDQIVKDALFGNFKTTSKVLT